jgi:hypothetical protein
VDKTETTTTTITTTYTTVAQDGSPLYAVIEGDTATVHYESPGGFVIAAFPTDTLPQLAALITAVIAATDPVQASTDEQPSDPGTDPAT